MIVMMSTGCTAAGRALASLNCLKRSDAMTRSRTVQPRYSSLLPALLCLVCARLRTHAEGMDQTRLRGEVHGEVRGDDVAPAVRFRAPECVAGHLLWRSMDTQDIPALQILSFDHSIESSTDIYSQNALVPVLMMDDTPLGFGLEFILAPPNEPSKGLSAQTLLLGFYLTGDLVATVKLQSTDSQCGWAVTSTKYQDQILTGVLNGARVQADAAGCNGFIELGLVATMNPADRDAVFIAEARILCVRGSRCPAWPSNYLGSPHLCLTW